MPRFEYHRLRGVDVGERLRLKKILALLVQITLITQIIQTISPPWASKAGGAKHSPWKAFATSTGCFFWCLSRAACRERTVFNSTSQYSYSQMMHTMVPSGGRGREERPL